ncbi:hypothetical protein CDAR_394701 [Caerostris darwini]|uniref:Uncharacterized protein n=1 Tax=Caerostris darwini TaxID=1538125 RepID=A0AAV4PG43_9ARAC|nr:hypothetical protein CDAR_394701 [Caerostris darwini]
METSTSTATAPRLSTPPQDIFRMQKPSFQNSGRLCPELNSRTRCQPNVLQPFLSTNKYLSKMESCPGTAQPFIKRVTSAFQSLHSAPVAEVVKRGHTLPNRFSTIA